MPSDLALVLGLRVLYPHPPSVMALLEQGVPLQLLMDLASPASLTRRAGAREDPFP